MNDFEFVVNDKCNFDEDIDSSDNAALVNDGYDFKKEVREVSELKQYLKEQTIECSNLIKRLTEDREQYTKLSHHLQTELTQIAELKQSLQNDHEKFNKMLSTFSAQQAKTPMPATHYNNDIFDETNTTKLAILEIEKKDTEFETFDVNSALAQLPKFVQGCFQSSPSTQYQCCTMIRKLLCAQRHPPIQQVIDSGVVPRLIQFLRCNNDALQFEAAWALTNIASSVSEHTATVIRNGAIPVLIELIKPKTASTKLIEQAIWAIGNIAGDGLECRDLVIQCNALNEFQTICKNISGNTDVQFIINMSWVLVNFCRPKPIPKWEYIAQIIECYNDLIHHTNHEEVCGNYLWAFYYLTRDIGQEKDNLLVDNMVRSGVIQKAVDLLDHPSTNVRVSALGVIGNTVATQNDANTEIVLKYNILEKLHSKLLQKTTDKEKEEILWTLSNITAGTPEQIECAIKSNIFPTVIRVLNECHKYSIAKEAVWTIANATDGAKESQIRHLIDLEIIPAIFSFLQQFSDAKDKDHDQVILVTLQCVKNVVSIDRQKYMHCIMECGGIHTLKSLQTSDLSDRVANELNEFLETFYTNGQSVCVSDKEVFGDNVVLKSSVVCGWRYDPEQYKWRSRGKGHLTVYKNDLQNYFKIVFKDSKHQNTIRLLQQMNVKEMKGNPFAVNDERDIEWNGDDYSMSLTEPLSGLWKLRFTEEPQKAQRFVDIFNGKQ